MASLHESDAQHFKRIPIERQILFSGPMVRAILEGRKTQTRRVVRGVPAWVEAFGHSTFSTRGPEWQIAGRGIHPEYGPVENFFKCPYGQPGDRLWVRETWYCDRLDDPRATVEEKRKELYFRADVPSGRFADAGYWSEPGSHWRPSIHMPRWASRITLELTSVRVERLQEISEEDTKAEGIVASKDPGLRSWPYLGSDHRIKGPPNVYATARQAYADIWDSLNAKRGFGWEKNPWVWVLEFKRLPGKGGAE